MGVRQDNDGSLIPAVNAAGRSLVFLTVPWSAPERTARAAFRTAAEQLATDSQGLDVECFALDEEADWCQAWLAAVGQPHLGNGNPLGAGSMLWLELGRVVSHEIEGCSLKSGDIMARTHWLWSE